MEVTNLVLLVTPVLGGRPGCVIGTDSTPPSTPKDKVEFTIGDAGS